ncbi:hypothetical protein AURDEDRAFT_173910 [Auricularia subglabra TFB-10046 SS5]|nr:hypothetical protein AURDEDRAFT_173910 [Auricularia subglabra TFB-10046 SS5]
MVTIRWRRLPAEVLAMIFRCLARIDTATLDAIRVNLSAVCKVWSHTVQADSFFWSEVLLRGSDTPLTLSDRLVRGGSWPLTLRIDTMKRRGRHSSLPLTGVLDAIVAHSHRLRVLDVLITKDDLPSSHFTQPDSSLPLKRYKLDVPVLEKLRLGITPPMGSAVALDMRAPFVKHVTLHGVRPTDWSSVLSQHVVSVDVQQGYMTASSTLRDIISLCPSLRELHMAGLILSPFVLTDYATIKPLELNVLNLMLNDVHALTKLLELPVLSIPSVDRVSIAYPSGGTGGSAVEALLAGFGRAVWVQLRDNVIMIGNETGFRREVTTLLPIRSGDRCAIDDFRDNGAFATIDSVTISVRNWSSLVRAAPFLSKTLHIILLLDPGTFVSSEIGWELVPCASLARLTLRCAEKDRQTSVNQEDIEHIFFVLERRAEEVLLHNVVFASEEEL